MKTLHSTKRAGFTVVELAIAASLLALVLGSFAMMAGAGERAYRTGTTTGQLEAQVAMTLARAVDELRPVVFESIDPDPVPGAGAESMSYEQAVDIVAGSVVLSPTRRLGFVYEAGELDNGVDDNGNGLVDEGRLVLTENVGLPDERQRVLTRWVAELFQGELDNGLDDNGNGLVDENGFYLERDGETLIVRLTLERLSAEGRLLTRSAQTSVRMRN